MQKPIALAWALLILALCSIPGASVPDTTLFAQDKLGHFAVFFIGAFLWLRAWPAVPARVLAGGVIFSIATEVYQSTFPLLDRVADPLDVLADVIGLIVGLALALLLRQRRRAVA